MRDLRRFLRACGFTTSDRYSVADLCIGLLGTVPVFGWARRARLERRGRSLVVVVSAQLDDATARMETTVALARAWYRRIGVRGKRVWNQARNLVACLWRTLG